MAFATASDLTNRFDWRWIAKNILDGSTANTSYPTPTLAEVLASGVVSAALDDASDLVMAAAAIGDRYSVADLTGYGGNLLIRITCNLAMGLILMRRGRAVTDEEALSKPYTEALEYLEQLRRGERIFFAVPDVPAAGLPGTASMTPPLCAPPLISANGRIFGTIGNRFGPSNCGCN